MASFEEKKILLASIIRDKTVTVLTNNNSGNIIINKLMNSIKNSKEVNNSVKIQNPLSLNNMSTVNNKNKNENEKSQ